MQYQVSIQNKPVRRFINLSLAVRCLRENIYVLHDLDYIAGHIESEGYYRTVYGFNHGEITELHDTLPAMPAWAVEVMS